jgi:hypothetical protein
VDQATQFITFYEEASVSFPIGKSDDDEVATWAVVKEEANSNDNSNRFSLIPRGKLLTKDHPQSLRGMTLLEKGLEYSVI